jgi:hypothetical protein
MTKREALRQTHQENTLLALGFTHDEAEALRRISMTLHRWHELECGTDSYCIVRGAWNQDAQTFDYDDNGRPHYEFAGGSGRTRYMALPDREKGAKRRLLAIINAHAARTGRALSAYIQTDPRGAALYIIRPGDVPDGKSVESYYDNGIVVC